MKEIRASASRLRTAHVVPCPARAFAITPLLITLVAALQQLGALAIHLILLQSLSQALVTSGRPSPTSVRVAGLAPSPCNEDRARTAAKHGVAVCGALLK